LGERGKRGYPGKEKEPAASSHCINVACTLAEGVGRPQPGERKKGKSEIKRKEGGEKEKKKLRPD